MIEIKVKDLYWNPTKGGAPISNYISTRFEKGGFYGILGPNGSGKTSFARQILKLQQATEGEIHYDERDLEHLGRKEIAQNISFLPQNTQMNVPFSVYEVVSMGRAPYRKRFQNLSIEDKSIIEEAMEYSNCSHLRDRSIMTLSGGERQRVLIARTIAQRTPFVVLDEPISALDIKHQIELMHTLKELNEKNGVTVIAILHDLNMAANFCSHIVLMKDGQIYKEGEVDEVLDESILEQVYDIKFQKIQKNEQGSMIIMPQF